MPISPKERIDGYNHEISTSLDLPYFGKIQVSWNTPRALDAIKRCIRKRTGKYEIPYELWVNRTTLCCTKEDYLQTLRTSSTQNKVNPRILRTGDIEKDTIGKFMAVDNPIIFIYLHKIAQYSKCSWPTFESKVRNTLTAELSHLVDIIISPHGHRDENVKALRQQRFIDRLIPIVGGIGSEIILDIVSREKVTGKKLRESIKNADTLYHLIHFFTNEPTPGQIAYYKKTDAAYHNIFSGDTHPFFTVRKLVS